MPYRSPAAVVDVAPPSRVLKRIEHATMPKETSSNRRSFFQSVTAFLGLPVVAAAQGGRPVPSGGQDLKYLPSYARAQNYRSLKQSSYDTTGGN
ncbi:MAG TPA: hypothetical protein VN622_14275, partial [Clostridia bacterium]|nr:hypothetical protein [Clostridia bacterium]